MSHLLRLQDFPQALLRTVSSSVSSRSSEVTVPKAPERVINPGPTSPTPLYDFSSPDALLRAVQEALTHLVHPGTSPLGGVVDGPAPEVPTFPSLHSGFEPQCAWDREVRTFMDTAEAAHAAALAQCNATLQSLNGAASDMKAVVETQFDSMYRAWARTTHHRMQSLQSQYSAAEHQVDRLTLRAWSSMVTAASFLTSTGKNLDQARMYAVDRVAQSCAALQQVEVRSLSLDERLRQLTEGLHIWATYLESMEAIMRQHNLTGTSAKHIFHLIRTQLDQASKCTQEAEVGWAQHTIMRRELLTKWRAEYARVQQACVENSTALVVTSCQVDMRAAWGEYCGRLEVLGRLVPPITSLGALETMGEAPSVSGQANLQVFARELRQCQSSLRMVQQQQALRFLHGICGVLRACFKAGLSRAPPLPSD